jgi:hypothetical protein
MMMSKAENEQPERTEIVNPIANALSKIVDRNAATPEHVYRLAVIVEGLLDHLDDPDGLHTIRGELRALINDLSQSIPGKQGK